MDHSKSQAAHSNKRVNRPIKVLESSDDLKLAFEAAKQMEPGRDKDNVITQIAEKAIKSAPDIAGDAIWELPVGNDKKMALVEAYLRELVKLEKSPQAMEWIDSLENESEVAFARERVTYLLVEAHPERLPASSFSATGADPVAVEALQNWSTQKPSEAIAWAKKLPAGEARTVGFNIVLSQWFSNDAASALSWVDSQHNQQVRQETIGAAAQTLSNDLMRNNILEEAPPKLREELEKGIAEIARQKEAEESVPEEETPSEPEAEPYSIK